MKKLIAIIFILTASLVFAQNGYSKRQRPFSTKFEELEKIKLLETLNLDEEVAIKFFARRNKLKNNSEKISGEREAIFKQMEDLIDKKNTSNEFVILIEKASNQEIKLAEIRSSFIRSLDDILSKEQIVKLLIFERNFRKGVKNLLIEKGRKKYHRDRKIK